MTESKVKLTSERIIEAASNGEEGTGKLFMEMFRGLFVYDHAMKEWFECRNGVWHSDVVTEVNRALDEVKEIYIKELHNAESIAKTHNIKAEQFPGVIELRKAIKNICGRGFRGNALMFAASGHGSLAFEGAWDSIRDKIPTSDGKLINLRTNVVRDIKPDDFIRLTTAASYNASAKCDVFEHALASSFDEENLPKEQRIMCRFVQKSIGYAFCKNPKEHKWFLLHGEGRNGKGVLVETIRKVGGELCVVQNTDFFMDNGKRGNANAPDPQTLALLGKSVCFGSESKDGSRIDTSKMKQLASNDTLTGRALYAKTSIQFQNMSTIFMQTNFLPHVPADDYASWRRIILIHFPIKFVSSPTEENEKLINTSLYDELENELSGILNWIVKGAQMYFAEGLDEDDYPEQVKKYIEDYRSSEDDILSFMEEYCYLDKKLSVRAKSIYEAYKKWHEDNATGTPISIQKLVSKLEMRGIKNQKHKEGKILYGIALKS